MGKVFSKNIKTVHHWLRNQWYKECPCGILFVHSLYSGQEWVIGQISGPGGPLHDLHTGQEGIESIRAFHWVTSVRIPDPWGFFILKPTRALLLVKLFPICWCATQLSAAAVCKGEHWGGNYSGAGLGTKLAAKSGINKRVSGFNSGYTCPWLEELLAKEVDIALFFTSRRCVRIYLLFTLFTS